MQYAIGLVSLKNRDEVEIFQLPRFCYGIYPTTFFAQSLIRKKNGFQVIFYRNILKTLMSLLRVVRNY
jgi:hypothetical protein